jgi:hypothetical protein
MKDLADQVYDLEGQITLLQEQNKNLTERVDLITKILHTVNFNIEALIVTTERLEKEKQQSSLKN